MVEQFTPGFGDTVSVLEVQLALATLAVKHVASVVLGPVEHVILEFEVVLGGEG